MRGLLRFLPLLVPLRIGDPPSAVIVADDIPPCWSKVGVFDERAVSHPSEAEFAEDVEDVLSDVAEIDG